MNTGKSALTLPDGTVYSKRKNFCPFSTPPLEAYASIVGEERIERLQKVARQLKGLKLLGLHRQLSPLVQTGQTKIVPEEKFTILRLTIRNVIVGLTQLSQIN